MSHAFQTTLRAAVAHHQAGRLSQAEAFYRKIIAGHPEADTVLHLLGLVAHQRGNLEEAERWVRQALSFRSEHTAEYSNTLGFILSARGETAEGCARFQDAIALKPDYTEAHQNLGRTLFTAGRVEESASHFEKVLQLNPSAPAYMDMAAVCVHRKMNAQAVTWFEKAVQLDPENVEAWDKLGAVLNLEGKVAEAFACFEKAVKLNPQFADAWNNMSVVRHYQGCLSEAREYVDKAIALNPGLVEAYVNRAAILSHQGKLPEAALALEQALTLRPDSAQAYHNLGYLLQSLCRFSESIACYDKVLKIDPNYLNARWNRSQMLFLVGQIKRAWAEYECGWAVGQRTRRRPFRQPRWDGSPLGGKKLLFWGEQGVGDEIIWAGMVPDLGEGHIVECDSRLVSLFARSFAGVEAVPRTTPPHPSTAQADLQIPGASAGRWLRNSLEQFPRHQGYLRADADRVAHWRRRLDDLGTGLTIGICWRSGLTTGQRAIFYAGLHQWGPVLSVPGVHFVNLQYDDCRAELDEARARFGVPIHEFAGIDLKQDLDEGAALTTALDLVISANTAVAVMAGALGKPTWILTFTSADTLFSMGQKYIPWFPSMQVYGRLWDQSWDSILERLGRDLAELAAGDAIRDEIRETSRLPAGTAAGPRA